MEKEQWIENILNSPTGMTTVNPSDDLLSRIHHQIKQQEKASPATVWLVAASILVLVALNLALLNARPNANESATAFYLENALNQSNQLY